MAGVGVWRHSFLTSTLDAGDQTASRPHRFIPGNKISSEPSEYVAEWATRRSGHFGV